MGRYRLTVVGGAWLAAVICAGPAFGQGGMGAVHDALHLNAAQEQAWQAYQANVAAPAQAQARRSAATQMFPHLSAPQRMDLVEAEMKQELADLRRQSQAMKLFYATLSLEQQRLFDTNTLNGQPVTQ